MRVRDKTHYEGEGILRFQFSTDERRLPVRIQSVLPLVGTTTMTLSAYVPAPSGTCHFAPRVVTEK